MNIDFRPLFFLMFFPVVWGCSSEKRPDGMPPLHPCRITITQDGAPLEGATVVLHATSDGTRWRCSGVTDAGGVVNLQTQGQFRGVPAGTYKVTVEKEEVVSLATPEQLAALERAKAENPQWYDPPKFKYESWQLVSKEYTQEATTLHEITVSSGQNSATFDVGKAVRVKQDLSE